MTFSKMQLWWGGEDIEGNPTCMTFHRWRKLICKMDEWKHNKLEGTGNSQVRINAWNTRSDQRVREAGLTISQASTRVCIWSPQFRVTVGPNDGHVDPCSLWNIGRASVSLPSATLDNAIKIGCLPLKGCDGQPLALKHTRCWTRTPFNNIEPDSRSKCIPQMLPAVWWHRHLREEGNFNSVSDRRPTSFYHFSDEDPMFRDCASRVEILVFTYFTRCIIGWINRSPAQNDEGDGPGRLDQHFSEEKATWKLPESQSQKTED